MPISLNTGDFSVFIIVSETAIDEDPQLWSITHRWCHWNRVVIVWPGGRVHSITRSGDRVAEGSGTQHYEEWRSFGRLVGYTALRGVAIVRPVGRVHSITIGIPRRY